MADERDGSGTPGESAAQEQDALFRLQMALSDVMLGYWKHGAALIGLLLLGTLVYGGMRSYAESRAKSEFGQISRIDHRMPKVDEMARMGFAPVDDPTDSKRMADLEEGGRRYLAVADGAHGAAAVDAYLKAADAFRRAGKADLALSALEKGAAVKTTGLPGFTADAALASALVDAGQVDRAVTLYREMVGRHEGFFAEQALLRLAATQIDAGKSDDAKATLGEFKTRFPASPRAARVAELEVLAGKGS